MNHCIIDEAGGKVSAHVTDHFNDGEEDEGCRERGKTFRSARSHY